METKQPICAVCALEKRLPFDFEGSAKYCLLCGRDMVQHRQHSESAKHLIGEHQVFLSHLCWVLRIEVDGCELSFRITNFCREGEKRTVTIAVEQHPELGLEVTVEGEEDLKSARYWHNHPTPFERKAVERAMKGSPVPFVVTDSADLLACGIEGVGFQYRSADQTVENGVVKNHLSFLVGKVANRGVRVRLTWPAHQALA